MKKQIFESLKVGSITAFIMIPLFYLGYYMLQPQELLNIDLLVISVSFFSTILFILLFLVIFNKDKVNFKIVSYSGITRFSVIYLFQYFYWHSGIYLNNFIYQFFVTMISFYLGLSLSKVK